MFDRHRAIAAADVVRRCKSDRTRHILGPGSAVALLAAALLLREDVRPVPDVQRANALRSLELVCRDRQEVDAKRLDVEVDPRRSLYGVDMEEDPAPRADPGYKLGDRLDRADLVVGEHQRDEDRPVGER